MARRSAECLPSRVLATGRLRRWGGPWPATRQHTARRGRRVAIKQARCRRHCACSRRPRRPRGSGVLIWALAYAAMRAAGALPTLHSNDAARLVWLKYAFFDASRRRSRRVGEQPVVPLGLLLLVAARCSRHGSSGPTAVEHCRRSAAFMTNEKLRAPLDGMPARVSPVSWRSSPGLHHMVPSDRPSDGPPQMDQVQLSVVAKGRLVRRPRL